MQRDRDRDYTEREYTGMPRSTAVAIFDDRASAEQAVEELRRAGFPDEQIGFIIRDGSAEGLRQRAPRLLRGRPPALSLVASSAGCWALQLLV